MDSVAKLAGEPPEHRAAMRANAEALPEIEGRNYVDTASGP